VAEVLLVAWPVNLTAASYGLSLLGVSRTARYDVLAVAAAWLALLVLDVVLRRPRPASALVLGVLCGIAALAQFMGSFVLPLVVLNWLWARARASVLVWMLIGTALALLPWAVFAMLHADDVVGQLTVYAGRGEFLRPAFYVENITQEAGRYEHALHPTDLSTWLLVLGIWPATAYVAWRSHRSRLVGDRVVWSSLILFAGLLLLLDHGKSSVYAIVLLPSICLAFSRLLTGVVATLWRSSPHPLLGLFPCAAAAGLVVLVMLDGKAAYQRTLEQADHVSPYAEVGNQVAQAFAPGARVLGPERWWWAVHGHPYLSLRSVWWQWANEREPAFVDGVPWTLADHVIVNDNVRDDVLLFPPPIQQRFWRFVTTCTTQIAALDDKTYFGIQIYRVLKPSPDPACARLPSE
jgi:hypothetical protein